MFKLIGMFMLALAITRCTAGQVASPAGQLFCAITKGATPIVAGIVTTVAPAGGPLAAAGGAIAVLALNAGAAEVQAACDAAAVAAGAVAAIPVAPPANPAAAPQVAIPPVAATSTTPGVTK